MSEIPIEINFTGGLIAIGVPLLSNDAPATIGTTLHSAQKKPQLFNVIRTLNKANTSSSDKFPKPYPDAISPSGKVLGLIGLRKTISVF